MAFQPSFAQVSLAATILISTVGTYIACTPPNQNPSQAGEDGSGAPPTNDLLSTLNLTKKHTNKFTIGPLAFLALHTCILALLYPDTSPALLRHGAENGVNPDLITWSPATAVPLLLILFVGIPLRLIAYSSLGKNFTFALSKPTSLVTSGIHAHVQHPSYTGVVVLVICNFALLARADGVMACWIPHGWLQLLRAAEPTSAAVGLSMLFFAVWTRVRQEERMLQAEFGAVWEKWHAETPRFIPHVF